MTKDDLKNKISMVLKDPILQQGFEIICKENLELEKRNEQLANAKKLLEWFIWYFREGNSNEEYGDQNGGSISPEMD